MSIRTKLLAIALLPLSATVILAIVIFTAQSLTASDAARSLDQHKQRHALTEAAIAIGGEFVDASRGNRGTDDETAVDRALVANSDFSLEVKSSLNRAAVLVSQARILPPIESWRSYQAAIEDLADAAAASEVTFPSIDVADNSNAVEAVVEVIASSDQAWVYFAQLGDAAVPPQQLTEAASLFALSEDARADVRRLGSGETADTIQTTLRLTESMSDYKRTATESLYSSNRRLVTPQQGLNAAADYRERWMFAYERSSGNLGFQISQEQARARRYQFLAGLGGLLALAVIGSLGLLVHRSITNPMQKLLDGTDRLTGETLPEMLAQMRVADSEDSLPPPPELERHSADEIGDLVNSFNDIGRLAHRLATQQLAIRENAAETLFNFGERQARQLDRLILALNGLEIDEQNIALLAKLGELDHLASTIRRNAQSIVVLGGDYTERHWIRPVDVEKVARASVANVEAYDRVNLHQLVPGFVMGVAASDLQHILAELIENSLNNSGPRTRVVVEGFWSGESYVLIVSDDGPGMSSAELSVSNSRLSTVPRLAEGPVTKLGLSVVGQLSARHGIEVSLTPKDHGVNAIVTLPARLVTKNSGVQVPTSLAGAPPPRTQREEAQLPTLTTDTMPPGALSQAPADAGSLSGDLHGDLAGEADETDLDYEVVAIPPTLESAGTRDSPTELAGSMGSEGFKGSVDDKMAAAIEFLDKQ